MQTITITGNYSTDVANGFAIIGRKVVEWTKDGVAQRLPEGATVVTLDRHGLPVMREGSTPAGCYPMEVTAGYGDSVTVE
jgi:hypothetical protein